MKKVSDNWHRAYREFLRSEKWRTIRAEILRAAGHRCRCGRWATHVHHLNYDRPFGQECYADLESLCGQCHKKAHGL